jgi:hypothetical protein
MIFFMNKTKRLSISINKILGFTFFLIKRSKRNILYTSDTPIQIDKVEKRKT